MVFGSGMITTMAPHRLSGIRLSVNKEGSFERCREQESILFPFFLLPVTTCLTAAVNADAFSLSLGYIYE